MPASSSHLEPTAIMPQESALAGRVKGICLLSLDAGGVRSVSQLKILAEIMNRINYGVSSKETVRPCDAFDMIGGAGSGGFIAILLSVLGFTAEQALDAFIDFSVNILNLDGVDAEGRTTALKQHITLLLNNNGIGEGTKLMDPNQRASGCKLVIPVSYRHDITTMCTLRNFDIPREQSADLTIGEALLVSVATPPLFGATSIRKDAGTLEFFGADLILGDPTQNIITEAQSAFGSGGYIACILSIGCGHLGVISTPKCPDISDWNHVIGNLAKHSEQKAEALEGQIGHLGIYHRYCVTRGLEGTEILNPGEIVTHRTVYLAGVRISRKLNSCVDLLKVRDGVVSFEQLKRSPSQVPLSPVPPGLTTTFVMRKEPWEFIEKAMLVTGVSEDADGQRMLIVTGIGGCGKTQIVLKFMRRHGNKYESVFFIDGSSEASIRADIVQQARSLGWMHAEKSFDESLLFLSQPSPTKPRLIIYDNVDDPAIDLSPLLPKGDSCAVIVTTRNRSLGQLSLGSHLELDAMSMEEAMGLLLGATAQSTQITRDDARAIAEEMGCLPIALTQARSYIFETACSGAGYLETLRSSKDRLLSQPVKHQRDMRYLSTYAAFSASFDMLPPRSQRFLRLLSCCYRSRFPLELILLAGKHHFSKYKQEYIAHGEEFYKGKATLEDIFLQNGSFGPTELDDMMVSLQNYSLITIVPGVETTLLQMHPLAHEWVRSSIPEYERDQYQSAGILLVALGAREDHTPPAQYLASHVTHMSPLWDKLHVHNAEAFARILNEAGLFEGTLKLRLKVVDELGTAVEPSSTQLADAKASLAETYSGWGRPNEAMQLQEAVLALRKKTLGERHPDTIIASSNLAITYRSLGRLDEARVAQEEVLRLRKEILGQRKPETIKASSNLALTYHELGRLDEARILQEEVLRLMMEILGERHPNTITVSSNLALTYHELGRLDEARGLQEEVLKLRKGILGGHHPNTISASSNLALTYHELGRLDEARVLLEEVLRLRKEILKERHPSTLTASSNLAITYRNLGRLSEARLLQEKVLRLRKEILGQRHPETIKASSNLALTYHELGRLDEARAIQEEVLRLMEEILGEHHPNTISASSNLARTYRDLERLDAALVLQEEVLTLRKVILGQHHPGTIRASTELGSTYRLLGRLNEALVLQEEGMRLAREIFGERHPDTTTASHNLALTYHASGRLDDALVLQEKTLMRRKETLGGCHPDTITASSALASIYCDLERLDEALALQEEVLRLRKEILGTLHPDTITASRDLAFTYQKLGRLDEAHSLGMEVAKLSTEPLEDTIPAPGSSVSLEIGTSEPPALEPVSSQHMPSELAPPISKPGRSRFRGPVHRFLSRGEPVSLSVISLPYMFSLCIFLTYKVRSSNMKF